MSFLFVDRIFEIEEGKSIKGIKNVTKSETFIYGSPETGFFLNPAIVSEAVLQLGSWLCMYSSNFKERPVILRIPRCDYPELVRPGDQIAMSLEILGRDEDVITLSAHAQVNGKEVLRVSDGQGYLMALEEFDSERSTRKQFEYLYRPEFKDVSRVANEETLKVPQDLSKPCTFHTIDRVQNVHKDNQISTLKQYSLAESYFKDHFPRMPVVPGVMQLTSVGETAQILAMHINPQAVLVPKYISDGRLRKFIQPGMECVTTVELTKGDLFKDRDLIEVSGRIEAEGQKMMLVKIGFENVLRQEEV